MSGVLFDVFGKGGGNEDSALLTANHVGQSSGEVSGTVTVCNTVAAANIFVQSATRVDNPAATNLLPSVLGDPIAAIQLDRGGAVSSPVQVTSVDGLVSTFTISQIMPDVAENAHSSADYQGTSMADGQHATQQHSAAIPMVLDFSPSGVSGVSTTSLPMPAVARRRRRQRSMHTRAARRRMDTGPIHGIRPNTLPVQGPLAPPQREDERQRLREDVVEGLIDFFNHNNALVRLFRTARDKLREADIPNFQIRLFGVAGSNQYELPTADTIGAIVYEGGPEYLKPTENTKFIEARVYRTWTAMKVPSLIATGFSCILLDKKGSAIQANADLKEKDRFERDLQTNCVYRIEGFGFEKTDGWGKTLDNDFTLCFGKHTRTDLLQDNDFPYHYFDFAAYNELGPRLDRKNPILTDYIGYIHNVEKVKEYGSAAGNKLKVRNIALRNLKDVPFSNNVVLFTLWNDKADKFEEQEYAQMRKPVILAVSSCYIKRYGGQLQLSATSATHYYFNPPIDETSELLAAYNQQDMQSSQLELRTEKSTDWDQERNRNRVPLGTLMQIDPNTQQEVMILQIDTNYDWYYQKCDECGGRLDYGFVHGQCHPYGIQSNPQNSYSFRVIMTDGTGNAVMTCFSPQTDGLIKDVNALLQEVANIDPKIIPPQILALQNTRHVFQFRFAKPTAKGPPTFVLQKVMDNPPSSVLAITEGPSSAPATPPDSLAFSKIGPPPVTPATIEKTTTDAPTETNVPSTSVTRKELFKDPTDEEIYLESLTIPGALTTTKPLTKNSAIEESPLESTTLSTTSNTRKDIVEGIEGEETEHGHKKQKLE
ncbi:nucleic acid-binding, OB-fold protein [Artemisia annua]|uniref:Nucleic acid-binding, OB-fold protein n=1 Tax=Artemisia annua TaxID=35608 RepID=A0A2U1MU10_ARTAN|nr:nucleic acid-binding, OB-fold protein [Artemisia annua]